MLLYQAICQAASIDTQPVLCAKSQNMDIYPVGNIVNNN